MQPHRDSSHAGNPLRYQANCSVWMRSAGTPDVRAASPTASVHGVRAAHVDVDRAMSGAMSMQDGGVLVLGQVGAAATTAGRPAARAGTRRGPRGGGRTTPAPAERNLGLAAGAVDQGGLAAPVGQFAEQREQRRNADPAGQHHHRSARVRLAGQPPVRALDRRPGCRAAGSATRALPSPRSLTVIRSRSPVGVGRQRVRVGPRPAGPVEEPPLEELPGPHRQPSQPPTAQVDRGQPGPLRHHVADREPVPPGCATPAAPSR